MMSGNLPDRYKGEKITLFETFKITVNQELIMFTFMLIGFFMKRKQIGGDMAKVLSALEVNFFLPAVGFLTFYQNCTVSGIGENISFLFAGIAVIALTFFIAKFLSELFGKDSNQKDIYMYSFLIPNIGYMGYPLVEAVFGEKALFQMMVFVLPFQIMIFTYGIYILNPNREWSLKKILNPNLLGITLGIVFGLLGIKLPPFLQSAVIAAKACMSPTAMILMGFVLGAIPLKPVFRNFSSYIAAVIRGIVIPGTVFALMSFLKVDKGIILIAVATLAMPFGLNSVVFPEAFGGDSETGAKTCFISNLTGLITIPLVFAFLA